MGKATGEITSNWWNFASEFERELKQARGDYPNPGEMPFDFPFTQILIGAILSLLGLALVFPIWMIIITVKLIPGTLFLYTMFWKEYIDSSDYTQGAKIACCPCFILANLFVPLPALGFYVFSIFQGLFVSVCTGVVYFDHGSILMALQYMPMIIREYDSRSTKFLFTECLNLNWEKYSLFEVCCDSSSDGDLRQLVADLAIFR